MSELSEKYENLKVSSRNGEEEASRRLDAAEKKSGTRLQELRAFKCRVGIVLESASLEDLTIEVEGRTIQAHRCILASRYV